MLMRAGLSYTDWRAMSHFQRTDYLARSVVAMQAVQKKLNASNSVGDVLAVVVNRLLGF